MTQLDVLRVVLAPSSNPDIYKLHSALASLEAELEIRRRSLIQPGHLVVLTPGTEWGGRNGFSRVERPGLFASLKFYRVVTMDRDWAPDRPDSFSETVTAQLRYRHAERAFRFLDLPSLHMRCVKAACGTVRENDHILCPAHAAEGKAFSSKYGDRIDLRIDKLNALQGYTGLDEILRFAVRREIFHLREVLASLKSGRPVQRVRSANFVPTHVEVQKTRCVDI